jgi:hypothetical protein
VSLPLDFNTVPIVRPLVTAFRLVSALRYPHGENSQLVRSTYESRLAPPGSRNRSLLAHKPENENRIY